MNIINDLEQFEDKRHLRTFCNVLGCPDKNIIKSTVCSMRGQM